MSKIFLEAEWRKLAIVNYAIDPALLLPYLPFGTELDFWNDLCYVSLVGFMFQNTKVLGMKIPFHINFEEVNLRFYVKRFENGQWRRGVVFIKEIVPKKAITFIANTIYKEHYQTVPMRHLWQENNVTLRVQYEWKYKDWHSFEVLSSKQAEAFQPNSEAEFITEHYWGYTQIAPSKTSVYEVRHPKWLMYPVLEYQINVDFEKVYGKPFAILNHNTPISVFLMEGSLIQVLKGDKINEAPMY